MVFIDYANADRINKLDTVWINGEEFNGIGYNGLLTVNTKTYVSEPTRANDGSMPNIADHETFIVPRCKINFKYMNINDYRRFCNAILPNEFPVRYFDKQFGKFVEHYMYCEPEEMTKIYNVGTSVIGVLDYEVSLIGTLNNLEKLTISYNANGGYIAGDTQTEYSSTYTYFLGDRVQYKGKYFEAIYYSDTFTNIVPSTINTGYWKSHSYRGEYSSASYTAGAIVHIDDGNNIQYYLCKQDNIGALINDKKYWQPITVSDYDENETYKKGDFVRNGSYFYEAIYFATTFAGVSPDNSSYWKVVPELDPFDVEWGQSIVIADPNYLFAPTSSNKTAKKWQVYVEGEATDTYYYANQQVPIVSSMVLKAIWE